MSMKFVDVLFYVAMAVMIAVVFAPIMSAVLFPESTLAFLNSAEQAV